MNKIILMSLSLFFIFSCKKDSTTSTTEADKDKLMVEENSLAESNSDDVSIIADDAYNYGKLQARGGQGGSSIMGDTVRITRVDSTITIDFGTTGVVGRDGKTRRGQIIVTFSNGFRNVGSSVTHSFNNYYVNGNNIAGSRTITYNGLNASSQPNWTIVSNLTITKSSGGSVTWSSTRTRTMVAGYNTPLNWTDDEYTISGSASGTNSNGGTYSITIGTPLYVQVGCKYILSGTITYTRNTRTATVDYSYGGTTTCDNQALLTYNGTTTVITL